MKAVRKKPGEPPEIVDVENTLEALQAEVGGYIESFQTARDCTILCNEKGKLLPRRADDPGTGIQELFAGPYHGVWRSDAAEKIRQPLRAIGATSPYTGEACGGREE